MGQSDPVCDSRALDELTEQLGDIRLDLVKAEAWLAAHGKALHPSHLPSAANLLHYVAFRRHDVRHIQVRLATLGLSSLGRAEAHVMASVNAVLHVLHRLAGRPWCLPRRYEAAVGLMDGHRILERQTQNLLGARPARRGVSIMVTMPSAAATDGALVRDLLTSGMDCMRINCAHDGPDEWRSMISHLREAEEELGVRCRVMMDLAGPKLRTGPVSDEAAALRWRPRVDRLGRASGPARIWLSTAEFAAQAPPDIDCTIVTDAHWVAALAAGDVVEVTDARDVRCTLVVAEVLPEGCVATSRDTAFVLPGALLRRLGGPRSGEPDTAEVGLPDPSRNALLLKRGDTLILTRSPQPGRPALRDEDGNVTSPARIACLPPDAFADVAPGERVWLDDGKIGGVVAEVTGDEIRVRITQARPKGDKLRSEKGINLPDSRLRLQALTEKDVEDLAFAAHHADMIGVSFVQSVADVLGVQARLAELGAADRALVLKIENIRAFENLPDLLLAAMRFETAGVMIARGDLAVECGYERLAEVQEEILWLCEAAHMPVIWATQVLENLAQTGTPSRAEITDAAMSVRAECVMLNKGPHVLAAVRTLDDILYPMQSHQSKKVSLLRELRSWSAPAPWNTETN